MILQRIEYDGSIFYRGQMPNGWGLFEWFHEQNELRMIDWAEHEDGLKWVGETVSSDEQVKDYLDTRARRQAAYEQQEAFNKGEQA